MRLALIFIIILFLISLTNITCFCTPTRTIETTCIIKIHFLRDNGEPYSGLYVTAIVDEKVYFKGKVAEDGLVKVSVNMRCYPNVWFIPIKVKLIFNGSYYIKSISQITRKLTLRREGGYSSLTYISPTITWEDLNETHSVYVLKEYLKCANLTQVRNVKLLVCNGALLYLKYNYSIKTVLEELGVKIRIFEGYAKPSNKGLSLAVPRGKNLTINVMLEKDNLFRKFSIFAKCENILDNEIDISEKIAKEVVELFRLYYSLISTKLSKYGVRARIYEHKLELMKKLLTYSQVILARNSHINLVYPLRSLYENYKFLENELETLRKKCYFYTPLIVGILIAFSLMISELVGKYKRSVFVMTLFISFIIMYLVSLELRVVIVDFTETSTGEPSTYYMRPLIPIGSLFPVPIIFLFKLVNVEHVLLNLKRRKLRFFLMLITICSVSVALMIHTSSFFGFIHEVKTLREIKTNTPFITIRKLSVERGHTAYPFDNNAVITMSYHEATGILNFFNVTGYFNAEEIVNIGNSSIRTFLTDIERLLENSEFKEALVEFRQLNGKLVLVSSKLSKSLDLSIGSKINIDETAYTISGIFNSNALMRVRDVDLLPLATKEYDIILSYENAREDCKVLKVIVLSNNVKRIADDLLVLSTILRAKYVGKDGGYITYGTSYILRYPSHGLLIERSYVDLGFIVQSDIISQLILSGIALLLLSINAVGIILERKREIQTLSCIGANPMNISCYVLTEAVTLGLVGGVIAFVIGRAVSCFIRIAYYEIVPFPGVEVFDILMAIIFSIGFTLIGYILPVRESIKTVIPSHLLVREKGKIVKVSKNEVSLIPFLRVRRDEIEDFIHYALKRIPDKLKVITITDRELLRDEKVYTVIIYGVYTGLIISGTYKVKIKIKIPLTEISVPRINIEFIPRIPPSKSDLIMLIDKIREAILEYSVYA